MGRYIGPYGCASHEPGSLHLHWTDMYGFSGDGRDTYYFSDQMSAKQAVLPGAGN
jgi:hypothetical protein